MKIVAIVVSINIFTFIAATVAADTAQESKSSQLQLKQYRIDRNVSKEAKRCVDCHSQHNSGVVADWANSRHAHANITCLD